MTTFERRSAVLATARLRLVPAGHAHVGDALAGAGSLAELMGLDVPPGMAVAAFDSGLLAQAQGLLDGPDDADWPFYYVIADLGRGPRLAGVVGYKGAITAAGTVEIGYAVRADLQGRGIATEAAALLIEHAFADPRVQAVVAETLAHLAPSIRILRKLGFTEVSDDAQDDVLRFELRRPAGAGARNPGPE